MSDRYVFHEDNNPQAETQARVGAHEAERIDCYEGTPLNLTRAQKSRLWCVLEHEVGPEKAMTILTRVELEV